MIGWYLCPMQRKEDPSGALTRYCAMDEFTLDIELDNGHWAQAEIDGNQAIVRVRADPKTLNQIKKQFTELSETEARSLWTPKRCPPYFDPVDRQHKMRSEATWPCKPLDKLVAEVPEDAGSSEVMAIAALWLGLGFGEGWRIPTQWAWWLAERGIVPDGGWLDTLLRTGLMSLFSVGGAFGDTGVVDDFDRTNESPINTNWDGPVVPAFRGQLRVVDNEVAGDTSGTRGDQYRSASPGSVGPDSEAFITIAGLDFVDEMAGVFVRLTNIGSGTTDGYECRFDESSEFLEIRSYVDEDGTQLGASMSVGQLNVGDKFGLEAIDDQIAAYEDTGSGWSQVGVRTDTDHTGAGNIGTMWTQFSRGDDFGGGAVSTAATSLLARSRVAMNTLLRM